MAGDQNPSSFTGAELPPQKPLASKDAKKKKDEKKDEDLVCALRWVSIFSTLLVKFEFDLSDKKLSNIMVDSFMQSEEDLALKQQLELYLERVQDTDPGVQKLALESMRYILSSYRV
jgi:hypothetical protein